MTKVTDELPPMEMEDEPHPMKVIVPLNGSIGFLATRNFSGEFPIWRKYKRIGWALRYVNNKDRSYG